jgi:hypothetical protein
VRNDRATLAFYAQPGVMTSAGRYASLLEPLPRDVAGLAAVAQGLVVHEHMAAAYGVTLSEDDRDTVHLRPVEQLVEQILARDPRPLDVARAPAGRVAGNCRHFTVLTVAMLRARGTPARARCGFGAYFRKGRYEDHWVCEYWDGTEERWRLADAQIDAGQRAYFCIDFDLTDVPRDQFLTGGDAWAQYRAGAADADTFGLSVVDEAGDWWIAGNLMRDAAALRNVELLPWDCWGAMPAPDDPIDAARAVRFDRLAALTQSPDANFAELQEYYEGDDGLRVPASVRNALRGREEAI